MKGAKAKKRKLLNAQQVKRTIKKNWQLYSLLLIPIIFVLIFKYGSMTGLVIAFKDYKITRGIWGSDWVGLKVFERIFSLRDFGAAVKNTLLLNILTLLFGFPMPIILAVMLNEIKSKTYKRVSQTLLYLPHFLSFVIIAAIAYQIFGQNSGILNNLLESLGASRIPFLQNNTLWVITFVFISVWAGMGWGTIVYLAAITNVNPELIEASIMDGANRFKRIWHITLPCIKPTVVTMLIMNLGKLMSSSFDSVYALRNMAATKFTTTIPILVFQRGIQDSKYSESTAIGLFQAVIGLVLVLGSDWIAKRMGEDGLL